MAIGEFAALAGRIERAPYNARLGIRVESIERDRVRLRVPFKDENANPGQALHGGVAASVIDIAGALAAWTGFAAQPELESGTLDLSVNYLAAAIGEDILATAEVLRRGKEITYSDVDVRNEAGKRIAKGLVTYRIVDRGASPNAAERQLAMADESGDVDGDVPKLARAFTTLPFMARLGISVAHMKAGHAVLHLPYAADNAGGDAAVHEGALAALMDTAGSMASWSITGLNFAYKASTVGMHVNYHAPAQREAVIARARVLRRADEIFLNQVTVSTRATRQVVATGTVTYRIVVPD